MLKLGLFGQNCTVLVCLLGDETVYPSVETRQFL